MYVFQYVIKWWLHVHNYAEVGTAPKVIVGFAYEYAYKDHEYRAMNTKHVQCTLEVSL